MKRFLSLLFPILLVVSLTACSQQTGPTETPASMQTEAQNTSAETPIPGPPPTPEPKPFVPMDIFDSELNLFDDMKMPDIFTVFEAAFDKGSAKMEGKCQFALSMTGSGDMFAAVAYLADMAGLSEDEKSNRINEYLQGGFCEFEGKDGRIVIIRQADPNDDRYAYVKADGGHEQTGGGCVIEIIFYVDAADVEKYTDLVRDNYNLNALTPIADYLDVETDFSECGITVNLHQNEARAYAVYYIPNVDAVQKSIEENVQDGWWEWDGMMQTVMQYGPIKSKLTCDSKTGAITIEQINANLRTAMGEYVEAEVSLTKFGFGFDNAGTCGVYEQHEPYYMNVAIHRPEWGEFNEDWNIEYYDTAVNGYVLR
ncbi:MAG: hypothetical protein ABFC62_11505, partial [Clostridiaceae bacterium]